MITTYPSTDSLVMGRWASSPLCSTCTAPCCGLISPLFLLTRTGNISFIVASSMRKDCIEFASGTELLMSCMRWPGNVTRPPAPHAFSDHAVVHHTDNKFLALEGTDNVIAFKCGNVICRAMCVPGQSGANQRHVCNLLGIPVFSCRTDRRTSMQLP